MATTALMIGGPWDGRVYALDTDRPFVEIAQSDHTALMRWGSDEPLDTIVSINRSRYERTTVALFGHSFPVWVHETVHPGDRDECAAKHLLSPLAKGLGGFDA